MLCCLQDEGQAYSCKLQRPLARAQEDMSQIQLGTRLMRAQADNSGPGRLVSTTGCLLTHVQSMAACMLSRTEKRFEAYGKTIKI